MKQPLSKELAGADGQNRAALLKALVLGVQAVVQHHSESHDDIVAVPQVGVGKDEEPQDQHGGHQAASHQDEPADLHSGAPGHDHKDDHIHHAGAHIAADGGDEAQHKHGKAADLHDGGDGADVHAPVPDSADEQGEQQDKGQLVDLVGLEVHGELGDELGQLQPVPIAVDGQPQGGEQQQQHDHAENEQTLPVLFGEQLKVHRCHDHIGDDTQENGHQLDDHLFIIVLPPGGGVDEYHAEAAGRQAQGEQNAVPFLKKLPKGREQGRQVLASLEKN